MGGRSNPGGGADELSRRPKQGSTSLKHKRRSDIESRLRSSYDVRLNTTDQAMSKTELSGAMSNYDAVVSTVSDPLDATVLQAGNRRVQLIANVG
jgi:lactate dehydrogenase-like 2-hydroxyacid dehydrogenase